VLGSDEINESKIRMNTYRYIERSIVDVLAVLYNSLSAPPSKVSSAREENGQTWPLYSMRLSTAIQSGTLIHEICV